MKSRLVLGMAVVLAAIVFYVLDLQRWLSLDAARASLDLLRLMYAQRPLVMLAGFALCYIGVTALSLPGATVMGLLAGAVFGFWAGTVTVSFASTIGATLAFLVSRHLFRDAVQERFGHRLGAVNAGLAAEGGWYLFTLRLIPVFPFFLINVLMGLTPMPTRTFYWVSQLGMLCGTMAYVNAGRELGRIQSLSGILSPTLLGAFAILGLLPLGLKKLLPLLHARLRPRA